MKVLVVTEEHVVLSSLDGTVCEREPRTARRTILNYLNEQNPQGVLFCGAQDDSLVQAVAIRRTEDYRNLPIALLGDEGSDLGSTLSFGLIEGSQLARRLQSLWTSVPEFHGQPRRHLIDPRARQIAVTQKTFSCSPLEFRLLLLFLHYPGIVFSRCEAIKRIRNSQSVVDSRIVDVLVRRLRKKIEISAQVPVHLRTIYGLGYAFEAGQDTFLDVESRKTFGCSAV